MNESWSGSHVSGDLNSAGNGYRCENLHVDNVYPDVILIYMGTNDYDHNVPLGNYDGSTSIPSSTQTFSDSYAIMLSKVLSKYKNSEVWCCTLQPMERHGEPGFPEINNIGLTVEDYNNVIRKIAKSMNCKILEHSECGITYFNMDNYFEDWNSSREHPNRAGHTLLAEHDIRYMI